MYFYRGFCPSTQCSCRSETKPSSSCPACKGKSTKHREKVTGVIGPDGQQGYLNRRLIDAQCEVGRAVNPPAWRQQMRKLCLTSVHEGRIEPWQHCWGIYPSPRQKQQQLQTGEGCMDGWLIGERGKGDNTASETHRPMLKCLQMFCTAKGKDFHWICGPGTFQPLQNTTVWATPCLLDLLKGREDSHVINWDLRKKSA